MNVFITFVPLLVLAAMPGCIGFGSYLIATSRRKIGPGPRCGQCGYNLNGATIVLVSG